ncbi:MAG: uncharacterized protein K0R38_7182 [Polyangiaceae bacterium]|jgi:hypothetical protein|nr:uncharacterized protein [Polyangiaceae bacterium]
MKSARSWREWAFVLGCGAALVVSAPACSLLFDINADQCAVDGDCARLGADLSCRAGICVEGASGGASGAATGGTSSSGAGQGGAGDPEPECAANGECIDANFGQPYACISGKCVSLVTEECPLVVGADNLRAPAPIIFGAYTVAPNAVSRSSVTRNIDLVISEVTTKVTGLKGGPNNSRRTLAFVVCNSYFPDVAPGTIDAFEPSLDHLVDDLKVPGIVSALSAKDLEAVFSQRLNAAGTFVISPFEQDSELAALADEGRLWNMLGATSDLAPAFGALLKRTEAYLRLDESFLNLPSPGAKLRVALVSANIARETDVRDALLELPTLDGFEVEQFQVESALLTGSPDVGPLATDLLDYAPHIIVALAGSEFIEGVFPVLEAGKSWGDATRGQQLPMYVLGSSMAPETWILYGGSESPGGFQSLMDRIVGVAYASAEDPDLRENYESRLISANSDLQDPTVLLGSESVYDATYLMVYAAAAAGQVPALTGKQLATGMQKLLGGEPYDVGPSQISQVLRALEDGEELGLNLTLGPPNWNTGNGTRKGVGSVYCLNDGLAADEADFPRGPTPDALRYDPETDTLESKPLRCISDF